MQLPPAGRSVAAALLLLLGLSGCTDSAGVTLQSNTVDPTPVPSQTQSGATVSPTDSDLDTESDSGSDPVERTGPGSTNGGPVGPASAEAESFKVLIPATDGLTPSVQQLAASADANRIDQLAASACGAVNADMGDSELGREALAAYQLLSDEERLIVDRQDWVIFYGAVLGFFCPEQIPDIEGRGIEPGATEGGDSGSPDRPEVELFRSFIIGSDDLPAETEAFVERVSDERLDQLNRSACQAASSELNTEQLGELVSESYETILSDQESSQLSLSGYSRLFGSLVGWFCPERLPR